jgi:hypothetical protein
MARKLYGEDDILRLTVNLSVGGSTTYTLYL